MNESAPDAPNKTEWQVGSGRSKATRFLRELRSRLRRRISDWIALGFMSAGRHLPHRSLALGRMIGMLWYVVGRRNREWALRNLDRAYGSEKSPAEITRIARQSYQSVGMAAFELALASRWDADYFREVATACPLAR